MPSNSKRLEQDFDYIRRIKAGDYPAVLGRDNQYQIVERPWQDLAEASKLAILTEAVDWSGITNRDQAHILLSEIDPGRIPDALRNRLIGMAAPTLKDILNGNVGVAGEKRMDRGMER